MATQTNPNTLPQAHSLFPNLLFSTMQVNAGEDEGFGDFTFAPISTVRSNPQSNAPKPSTSPSNDHEADDDDWGDFIGSPGPSRTETSQPNTSSFDLFRSSMSQSEPATSRDSVEKGNKSHWEKPKGALPLSLFGEDDAEEEQGSSAADPPAVAAPAKESNHSANLSKNAGINDLIANLYNQNSQIKGENGANSNFGSNGLNSGISRSSSLPSGSNSVLDGLGFEFGVSNVTPKSDSDAKGTADQNEGFENDDDDGWEFKVANVNAHEEKTDWDIADNQVKPDNLSASGSSWGAFTFDQIVSTTSINQPKSDSNGLSFDFFNGNKGFGSDDVWDFRVAESASQVGDADPKTTQTRSDNGPVLKFNANGSHSGISRSTSLPSGSNSLLDGLNFEFSQPNMTPKSDSNSKEVARSEEFDNDGWEFKAANVDEKDVKIDQSLAENGSKTDNLKELSSSWGAFSLDQNGSTTKGNQPNSGANGLSFNFFDGNKESGNGDVWDFRGAESVSQAEYAKPKVDQKADYHDKAEVSVVAGDSAHGPSNELATSDAMSRNQWGFGFDFNPATTTQNGVTSTSYPLGLPSAPQTVHEDIWGLEEVGMLNGAANKHNSFQAVKDFDTDEDDWEFKDALSEMGSKHKEDQKPVDISSAAIQHIANNNNAGCSPKNMFASSNETPSESGEWKFGFNFTSTSISHDGVTSDSYPKRNQNSTPVESKSSAADQNVDSDNMSREFESPSESDLKQKVVKEVTLEKKEVLPMSLFSDPDLESHDSLTQKEDTPNSLSSHVKTSNKNPGLDVSINDLISNLYNEAEKKSASVNLTHQSSNIEIGSKPPVMESNLIYDIDDFEDDSWEFKDASSGSKANDLTSVLYNGESHETETSKLELSECMELYCKLKDELCAFVLCHVDNQKKNQGRGHFSEEGAELATLDKEIEELYKELDLDDMIAKDLQSEHVREDLQEICGVLQEPKFQLLESELQLSKRLSMAEKDLKSAIKLLRYVASTLRILEMGSSVEKCNYVSTWLKVVSVCAQELKHGDSIWKQSLQENLHSQIASRIQGKRYILALGEVYRVVALIEASAKLYKPWILLSSVDPSRIHSLLDECSNLWSSSGLEEALRSISDLEGVGYDGTTGALLDSINHIHNLDEIELQKYVFSEHEPSCRLSLLKSGVVPGLELETWHEKLYFIKLANLWGNLVSCDPPNLPLTQVR